MATTRSKAWINYAVDILIAVAFVVAGVTAVILLLSPSGGFQGGRNPRFAARALSTSHTVLRDLHDWSGIAMMAGVLLHLVLHAKWISCMTRNLFRGRRVVRQVKACDVEA